MGVQTFCPKCSVERFHESVIGCFSWSGKRHAHSVLIGPQIRRLAGKLAPIIAVQKLWNSALDFNPVQRQYHTSTLVRQVLAQTTGGGRAWFSLLFGRWSSSSATTGPIDALNAIYELKESRLWWKSRLIALTLAIAMGVLLTAALIIVMYGPALLRQIAPSSASFYVWKIAQWPTAALLLVLALLGLYRFAPNIPEQKWKWLLPGSIVAAIIWIAVSVLFKQYVRHFSHFGLLYGSLGTLIILMLWFYLSGAAILIGGEINATLEDAAAKQKVPGAKKRGQRSLTRIHGSKSEQQ